MTTAGLRWQLPETFWPKPALRFGARPIAENFTAAGRMREVIGPAFGRHEPVLSCRVARWATSNPIARRCTSIRPPETGSGRRATSY